MSTEDETPLIYGLEFQARSLSTQTSDTDVTKFLVGTQTVKWSSNQVHVVEVDEEEGSLSSRAYSHPDGELWHLHWSPHNSQLISSCYNSEIQDGGIVSRCTLMNINEDIGELDTVAKLDTENVEVAFFHPYDGTKLATVCDSNFTIWDINSTPSVTFNKPVQGKGGQKLTNGKWNPQESGAAFATVQESSIKGWDLKINKEAWSIDHAHIQSARDIDYNRNRQHVLCSCGDDGLVKVWDLRNYSTPTLTLKGHTHWAWTVRFNPLHDELILSAGSDASGRLWWAASVASDPLSNSAKYPDGALRQYTAMEDSVYAAEWSLADPWTFALLSYDGRLLVYRVPKDIKYNILDI